MTTPQETIKLDQFLKLSQVVQTGGEAKLLIQSGEVMVNGEIETRRGRKLVVGDRVTVYGETILVEDDPDNP
ncbi:MULTISPECIES: RNA-binding S4 domain-containing protein [unclassified Leptolyngbya]|uniref:RNA-binding S4 domain-containing protein n=1 Tax=unclassified Leptolyngbya TaxID=2650499 RepID=UPI00168714AC|nr:MULTISPECIES: RNA-binding S4 domain-containing protein [unclassified Leptolyngbya]MBD1913685.1 RNA-binding S4 domain-containing protein [Leptolyngbya sp. FACHB-8]MBD2157065.1 RNA-binding S4 domain-containing protein [Leptolyngbya sp. FACHB-16]